MKYCTYCGKEIDDDSAFCPNCGCKVETPIVIQNVVNGNSQTKTNNVNGLAIAAIIFMVLGCFINAYGYSGYGYAILPFLWGIPMTVYYIIMVATGKKVSKGFKICSLLFVSLLGGIFMLCDKEH